MKKIIILLALTSTILFSKCTSKKATETASTDSVATTTSVANLTPTSLTDASNKVVDFKEITSKHKVTYVDFWASWCGPCRGEMPASQALREEYKGKDVNFVYISLDEEAADWVDANTSFALPNGQSFIIPNPSQSTIASQFNVSSIPRYLLIDSTGKVVDDNAPRPSETGRIQEALDKMLK
jgi:thiol-disulfide isomerase/thioredoxin